MNIQDLNKKIEENKRKIGLCQSSLREATKQYIDALDGFLEARRDLSMAEARAVLQGGSNQEERKAKKVLGAEQTQIRLDIAELRKTSAYMHREDCKEELENARSELSAIQSQVKLFETEANLIKSGF